MKWIAIAIIVVLLVAVFLIDQNNHLVISRYKYKNRKIKEDFIGYKIVQISDLHNKNFHGRLSKKIKKEKPNAIFITGDIIDANRTNFNSVKELLEELKEFKEVYYVSGNHEHTSGEYLNVLNLLNRYKINIIDDRYTSLKVNNSSIGLLGVADPRINMNKKGYFKVAAQDYLKSNHKYYFNEKIRNLEGEIRTDFNILLSHRPEEIETYADNNLDLVFSGHAHGGQIRLPFIGGIFSPKQGLFPKLTNGIHKRRNTSMIISRGLGNSRFPFRIFNRPEIVVVELFKN